MNTLPRRLVAAFAGLTVAASPLIFGLQPAHADGSTTLVAATLTTNHSSLSGTALATLTISLHLQDPNGVTTTTGATNPDFNVQCPCARLQTIASNGSHMTQGPAGTQAIDVRAVSLDLTSGSAQDGWWTGRTTVGANGYGHWQLTGVNAGTIVGGTDPNNGSPGFANVDGASYGADLDLRGEHWPVLTVAGPTRPVNYGVAYVVSGTARYSDTHGGIGGLTLAIATPDPQEWPQSPGFHHVTTDRDGHWSLKLSTIAFGIGVIFAPNDIAGPDNTVSKQYTSIAIDPRLPVRWLVAVSTRTSGSLHTIAARLSPSNVTGPTPVQLQRHSSRGWTVVVTRTTDVHMKTTFSTRTAGSYRAVALRSDPLAAAASKTVTV
jgi:hypothetical protein